MYKKIQVFFLLLLAARISVAQDLPFARKMVDTLTSTNFWGRGYTNNGMSKTAAFLADQFKSYGLKPVNGNSFLQSFSYPVNIFPAEMEVVLNGRVLIPGRDYIVAPNSRGSISSGNLTKQDSVTFVDLENKVIVVIKDKLTWSVAPKAADYTRIEVDRKSLNEIPLKIQVNIKNEVIPDFKASNICGIIRGTRNPDSIIVMSAHYDHLGGMGKDTYFPGANDNASGTTLLLGLAKYYAANPQPYSMVFLLFAGEEAGLLGSQYFTEYPLIDLKKIRFLTNTDMIGTGIDGITVVNGQVYPKEYSILTELNNEGEYLVKINSRGKAANSDHYWFTEKGVPAFFIYTLGGIKAYHDVFDVASTLPLNEYEDLLHLLVKFNTKLMN
jgi:aminopeptidase YwaD